MPELPEVETIKLQLNRFLVGHRITSVEVRNRKIFQGDEKRIVGAKVIDTRRFGKVTVIDLDNKYSILTHVKLTGQFIYRGPNLKTDSLSKKVIGGLAGPHTLIVFTLDKNGVLYYNDVRRFGWIKLEKTSEVENESFIKKLGPDMLKVDFNNFNEILLKTSRNIKALLMDQNKISGVGNIYVNDALWLSKISPKRTSKSLNGVESKLLFNALHTVLKTGLKYGGASELAFVTPDGKEGEYQNHTLVYGHQGEICKNCKINKIEKFFLGGRGTYWCSLCQK
ncbi:MAG TPA: bifunctional DNA-formamidopyrimidine glycosylase/DNA-(apurinic or apyrimidinic site) lyase [Patescibacteria group bacterium]|nr:bifunctional DNA-formamidopyrimidine glycosylase/DNA-(apurinic or apyrimidinic site) lyase [Patescibacteria group bacterium]